MGNYTPEIYYDDFVDECECCKMNIQILEGGSDE